MADLLSNFSVREADRMPTAESRRQAPAVPACAPDDDLSCLSFVDRQRVRAWAEDRLINAILPLQWHLERKSRGKTAANPTVAAAHHAVTRVMAAVEEARGAAWREFASVHGGD